VPVDFVDGAATKIDALLPEVLYRAFLADAVGRAAAAARRGAPPTDLDTWLRAAWSQALGEPALCAAARAMLAEYEIQPPNR